MQSLLERNKGIISIGRGVVRKESGTILKPNCRKRIEGLKFFFSETINPYKLSVHLLLILFLRAINILLECKNKLFLYKG